MSEDFKKKLQEYAEGNWPETEQVAMEAELEKSGAYRGLLDEMVQDGVEKPLDKERKIIRKGRRKFLRLNVASVIASLLGLYFLGMMLSYLYYGGDVFGFMSEKREAIDVAILTTQPNIRSNGGSAGHSSSFRIDFTSQLIRTLGNEAIPVGEIDGYFLFSRMSGNTVFPPSLWFTNRGISYPMEEVSAADAEWMTEPAFRHLHQLPEGTMAELYITFDQSRETEDVFALLRNRGIVLRWMAVATEVPEGEFFSGWADIGIPGDHYLLSHNWVQTSPNSGMIDSPDPLEAVEFREQEFLDALAIMQAIRV